MSSVLKCKNCGQSYPYEKGTLLSVKCGKCQQYSLAVESPQVQEVSVSDVVPVPQSDVHTDHIPRRQLHVVAVLETMWGDTAGEAARWFTISRFNHSGKRLYSLVGDAFLLVTNSCRELVTSASQHGKPDPEWLGDNLAQMERHRHIDVLLVCGKVAQKTYNNTGLWWQPGDTRIIEMPHPAARYIWTPELIERLKAEIASTAEGTGPTTLTDTPPSNAVQTEVSLQVDKTGEKS